MSKVAVFGAGSWGTAFSIVLADAGNDVTIWGSPRGGLRDHQRAAPEHRLPARHRAAARPCRRTHDPEKAAAGRRRGRVRGAVADVPREPHRVGRRDPPRRRDGLADEGRRARHPEADERGDRRGHRRRARSGSRSSAAPTCPRRSPAASRPPRWSPAPTRTSRSGSRRSATRRRSAPTPASTCSAASSAAPTRTSSASRSGMAVGLGFGDNTTASVITRGLAETARLAMALGANPLTLMGLAGLGDLVATCSSPLSRNRTVRREARQGHDHRGDLREHPPGRRGCEVVLLAARPRPSAPASTPRSPSTSTPSSRAG